MLEKTFLPVARRGRNRARRGFTLMELALVFGIVAIILGAIWAAYSSVRQARETAKMQEEILAIVHNVRTLYGAQGGFANTGTVTDAMVTAGVFPGEMLDRLASPPKPLTPWGAAMEFYIWDANSFWLLAPNGVSAETCARVLASNLGEGQDPGLLGISNGGTTEVPVVSQKLAGAVTVCNGANGFGLRFRLK